MNNKIMAIALVVSNLEKAVDFYQNKLGLKLKTKEDGFADFETQGTTLALLEQKTAKELAGNKVDVNVNISRHMILAWEATDDVDKLYNELKLKGVQFSTKPKTMSWGQRVAYFSDTDGNLWEISQFLDKD